jgi:hypothetical protein
MKKNHENQFSTNLMLNEEIEKKKNSIKKRRRKNLSLLG